MKDKQKQVKDDPKIPRRQVQIRAASENLSEAELERVAGGGNVAAPWPKITGSRSNIKNN